VLVNIPAGVIALYNSIVFGTFIRSSCLVCAGGRARELRKELARLEAQAEGIVEPGHSGVCAYCRLCVHRFERVRVCV